MRISFGSLVERVRDVTDQSSGARAGDEVARRAVGRDVLQALDEMDRIAMQGSDAPVSGAVNGGTVCRVLCATDGNTTRVNGLRSGQSPGVRVAASNTGLIGGAAARNASSLVCAAVAGVSVKR
jgi:hypothetical protein